MVLDLDFADFAQQELNNIWGGAKSRSYPADSYDGTDDDMTLIGHAAVRADREAAGRQPRADAGDERLLPAARRRRDDRQPRRHGQLRVRRPAGPASGPAGSTSNHDWSRERAVQRAHYAYCTPHYVMGTAELKPGTVTVAPSARTAGRASSSTPRPATACTRRPAPPSFSPDQRLVPLGAARQRPDHREEVGLQTSRRWCTSPTRSTRSPRRAAGSS